MEVVDEEEYRREGSIARRKFPDLDAIDPDHSKRRDEHSLDPCFTRLQQLVDLVPQSLKICSFLSDQSLPGLPRFPQLVCYLSEGLKAEPAGWRRRSQLPISRLPAQAVRRQGSTVT